MKQQIINFRHSKYANNELLTDSIITSIVSHDFAFKCLKYES